MDYEQYVINETPVEEEETKNEIVPVETTEEPEKKKSGSTGAGIAIGALLTMGIFAVVQGAKKVVKHRKAKTAAKKGEASHEDDEWEDEPDEVVVDAEETTEKKPEKK